MSSLKLRLVKIIYCGVTENVEQHLVKHYCLEKIPEIYLIQILSTIALVFCALCSTIFSKVIHQVKTKEIITAMVVWISDLNSKSLFLRLLLSFIFD